MSILVVDDEAEIRHLLSAVLTDEGYVVTQAKNGYTALAYFHKKLMFGEKAGSAVNRTNRVPVPTISSVYIRCPHHRCMAQR